MTVLYRLGFTCSLLGGLLVSCQKEESAKKSDDSSEQWRVEEWKEVSEGLESRLLAEQKEAEGSRFTKIEGGEIGVDFANLLKRENIKNYLLSGAGLTVGDVDGNGLPDLFLVSQDGANKLFKQMAPWEFVDATAASGILETNAWGAGAAFVDLDNDGDLDLFLCNKGSLDEVYLNQGGGRFVGNFYGAGDPTHRAPTMVAASDYDRDGDLDLYRTETRMFGLVEMFGSKVQTVKDEYGEWRADPRYNGEFVVVDGLPREMGTRDYLFRNDGPENGLVRYTDVTREAGLSLEKEHGLAAVWWDINNDMAPDLYVSNDFHTPDHLYQNDGKGGFVEVAEEALPYTSWSSMGSDFADINNDGWFDYLSTDMSATSHFKQKTMMGAMVDTAWFLDNLEPRQYMRNALQVNTGTGKFLDVAFYAGLDSTDWTWSGIFGDLDNDGLEDAFFTNGIERNVQDSDAAAARIKAKSEGATEEELHEQLLSGPRFKEKNLVFKNQGGFEFSNESESWRLDDETVSHGAVLVDLDRDGDLDLVVSNMNDPVGIYRNDSSGQKAILVSLVGEESNRFGLGARIEAVLSDGQKLSRMVTSSRGYMSGVEAVTHFGLGENELVKEMVVRWPSGRVQSFADVKAGYHYRVSESGEEANEEEEVEALFVAEEGRMGIEFQHRENDYNDFISQPLLPNRLSQFGPAMEVGDLNGDGRLDLYFGGAEGAEGALFFQGDDGKYDESVSEVLKGDVNYEDVAAKMFDADGDGDLDLYVVSGGASRRRGSERYRDRLYLNDGKGAFERAADGTLPDVLESGACVEAGDFDGDRDLDLFVGGRHVPGNYPTIPQSVLLRNEGGKFEKVESVVNEAGLVTGAQWGDFDGDGRLDLLVACEWGPVKFYQNTPEGFVENTGVAGLAKFTGWWTCVQVGDLDQDGDLDFVAGNFGLNTKYKVDAEHPATLFAHDFGGQGKLQLVEAKSKGGKLLPVRGRSCSASAMPHLLKNAPSYTAFASMSLQDLYTPQALDEAIRLEANTLATTVFWNDGKGRFKGEALPTLSQLAPVMDIAIADLDGDGLVDIALGQNFNGAQRETGRMNAGLGVVLTGDPEGGFRELWPAESGFFQRDDLRGLVAKDLDGDGAIDLITANNGSQPRVFKRVK